MPKRIPKDELSINDFISAHPELKKIIEQLKCVIRQKDEAPTEKDEALTAKDRKIQALKAMRVPRFLLTVPSAGTSPSPPPCTLRPLPPSWRVRPISDQRLCAGLYVARLGRLAESKIDNVVEYLVHQLVDDVVSKFSEVPELCHLCLKQTRNTNASMP